MEKVGVSSPAAESVNSAAIAAQVGWSGRSLMSPAYDCDLRVEAVHQPDQFVAVTRPLVGVEPEVDARHDDGRTAPMDARGHGAASAQVPASG